MIFPLLLLAAAVTPLDGVGLSGDYGNLPLSFEANHGQTNPQVRFLVRGNGYTAFFTPGEIVLSLRSGVVRMRLAGSNPSAPVEALDPLPGTVNYFIGNDPSKWRTDIPTYARVRYRQVYPGVNLVFYGNRRRLEYDIEVTPGADPRVIQLAFEGTGRMRVSASGDLELPVGRGVLRQHRPLVYQTMNGKRRLLEGRYVLRGKNRVGFQVLGYNPAEAVFIDPVLSYASYLGGSRDDRGFSIAVDASGSAYVAGFTQSNGLPVTTGAFRGYYGGSGDAFVAKLNSVGTALVYCTYLGGAGEDGASSIAVDSAGNALVAGGTRSLDFPTTKGAYQTANAGLGQDAFVTKLNAAGSDLIYSTYLGGNGDEAACGSTLDGSGNAYLTGSTASSNFPRTAGALRAGPGGQGDIFVTKLNANGSGLVYSTALGGSALDMACSIQVDKAGNAHITGDAYSADFPTTPGAVQPKFGGGRLDLHVVKLNPEGTAFVYSTYLGGKGDDTGFGLALDSSGNAYVTGGSDSSDFPVTAGALQTALRGPQDAVVAKLSPDGRSLLYSTYLGGSGADIGLGIALDSSANICVTGGAGSADFPITRDAVQTSLKGLSDAFVTKIKADGSGLLYSTFLGGSQDDDGLGIVVDSAGSAYVAGETTSSDFPTTAGAPRTTSAGGIDAFVAKISFEDPSAPRLVEGGVVNAASFVPGPVSPGEIITIFGSRIGPAQLVTFKLTPAGLFDTTLAETKVTLDNLPAPLIYVSATQVSAIVPYAVAGKATTQLQLDYRGIKSNVLSLAVAPAAPGMFSLDSTGKGPGAILNQDMSVNSVSNPASRGGIVVLYVTGEGQTRPPGVDGKLTGGELPKPVLPVSVRIGGLEAEMFYAGGAPGLVAGLLQVNARVPEGVSPGNSVPVVLRVGVTESQPGVTVAIQ